MSKRRLRAPARTATLAEFAPGETIIFAGDRGNFLYVILQGKAKTIARRAARALRTRDYFREVGPIDGRPRSAPSWQWSHVHVMKLPSRSDRQDRLLRSSALRPGARSDDLHLQPFDELPRMDAARDLARLVTLPAQQMLIAPVELEAAWQDVGHAIEARLKRTISGKAVLHVHVPGPRASSPSNTGA